MFCKGRGLFVEVMSEFMDLYPIPWTLLSFGKFKARLKIYMLFVQSLGSSDEWIPENFRLCTQIATRKSQRLINNAAISNAN